VPGYLPKNFENAPVGQSTNTTIAGGDVRLFDLVTKESSEVVTIMKAPAPPASSRPKGRAICVICHGRSMRSLREEVLKRPSFFVHFDTVVVDWSYVEQQSLEALEREGRWAARQSLRIIVDFTAGINLYPDLRFCNNSADEYAKSVRRTEVALTKISTLINISSNMDMPLRYAQHAILSWHRLPENYYSLAQCRQDFVAAFKRFAAIAEDYGGLRLHLRLAQDKLVDVEEAIDFIGDVGSPLLQVAPSTALLQFQDVTTGEQLQKAHPRLIGHVGLWLAASPVSDPLIPSRLLSGHGALASDEAAAAAAAALFRTAPEAPVLLDAALPTDDGGDAEFREAEAFRLSVEMVGVNHA